MNMALVDEWLRSDVFKWKIVDLKTDEFVVRTEIDIMRVDR